MSDAPTAGRPNPHPNADPHPDLDPAPRRAPRPSRGTRISRVPGKPVRREEDGSLRLDLWLQRDGTFDMDLALRLSPAEAEVLHAQLCHALDEVPVTTTPDATPDCRKKVLGGTTAT